MKNKKRICRGLTALLCLTALALCFIPVLAGASDAASCTLCIEYMDETVPIEEAVFRIYRAADLLEHGEYSLSGQFADSGAVLQNQMTNAAWEEAALRLADCAQQNSIAPYASGQTGSDGMLLFSGLPAGLYLVEGDMLETEKCIFQPQVFCVVLPGRGPDGTPEYFITAAPKYESVKKPELVIEKEQSLGTGSPTTDRLSVKPFDVITYYLTVRNISEADASEVVVTDVIPQGLSLKEGSDAISDGGRADGNVITWHLGKLAAGAVRTVTFKAVVPHVEEYTLWENAASLDYKENKEQPKDSNTVEAEEEPAEESETGSIIITKKLTFNGLPLAAKDAVFYVALYADEECTVRVTELKQLKFVMSSCEPVLFTGLETGRTYYVGESDAEGNVSPVGEAADGTPFLAVFGQGSAVELKSAEKIETLVFENEFLDFPVNYMREGTLTITKQVLDENGEPKESDEVFYAGIFADEAHTVLSDAVSENIVAIPMNGSSQASVQVNSYCADDEILRLYVAEVTADGTPVDGGFAYVSTVEEGEPEFSIDLVENTVVITNQVPREPATERQTEESTQRETEKPAEQPSPTPDPTPQTPAPGGTPTEASADAVQTGDDTSVVCYLLLLAAALAAALTALRFKKRTGA